jgi:hypothetical protein
MDKRRDPFWAGLMGGVLAAGVAALIAVGLFYGSMVSVPLEAAYIPVPSGTIAYFNKTACPTGWTEFTSARGAYIVGRVASGTLATLVGTALSDQENRPVGQHTHTLSVILNDPGHRHNGHATSAPVAGHSAPGAGYTAANNDNTSGGDDFTTTQTTGITVSSATAANAGTTAGTNAPYLQLLVCQKS